MFKIRVEHNGIPHVNKLFFTFPNGRNVDNAFHLSFRHIASISLMYNPVCIFLSANLIKSTYDIKILKSKCQIT